MRERIEQLRSVAYQLGMNFQEKEEYGMIALLRDFKLFRIGSSKQIFNLLQKASEMLEEKISVFDYQYTIHANNASITHYQTVFFIQSKELALPQMLLKPENFFHKIGAWFGMQDIDFVEQPEFSDRFLLKGEDEPRIRHTLSEEVMKFFLIEKKWCMESVGYYLVFYRENSLAEPSSVKSIYQKGMRLYELLKLEQW